MTLTYNSWGSLVQKTYGFAEEFRFCDDYLLVLSHGNVDDGIDIVDVFNPFNLFIQNGFDYTRSQLLNVE